MIHHDRAKCADRFGFVVLAEPGQNAADALSIKECGINIELFGGIHKKSSASWERERVFFISIVLIGPR